MIADIDIKVLSTQEKDFYILEEVTTEADADLKYWLGNRHPDRWRDTPEEAPEETGRIDINITVREPASKEIPEEYFIADTGQEDGGK